MRILYFSQFFTPEHIAAAFRAHDHAALWKEAGHEVTVFTGWPNYPTGRVFDGYTVERLGEENVDGVRVLRSKSVIAANKSFAGRIAGGASFLAYGYLNCLTRRRVIGADYDVVLATSGTVFAAMVGRFYARRIKAPFVLEIRDITYRQMVATGSSEGSWKVRAMKALELRLCRSADRVVVLTEGFRKTIVEEGVTARKVSVVPNGADVVPCKHEWSSGEAISLGYFGTMGISQDVAAALDLAASAAASGFSVSCTLIGEGASRTEVEEGISSGRWPFARLLHGMPKDELEPYYAQVDMTIVSLQGSDSFADTIPSKIFQSLARGVPVLFVGPEGEAARLVRESGAGLVLSGMPEENAAVLAGFLGDPDRKEKLASMSSRAVGYMRRNFSRKLMAERMLDALSFDQ